MCRSTQLVFLLTLLLQRLFYLFHYSNCFSHLLVKIVSEAEEEMARDDISLGDTILYLFVPLIYFLIWEFLISMRDSISFADKIGRILSMGLICGGFGINSAHELGHRKTKYEKLLSKILLLPSLYMHFFIEHNRGHHKRVSTQRRSFICTIWRKHIFFWLRAVSFGYLSAWNLENSRLKRNGSNVISIKNEMIIYQLIQFTFIASIYLIFGFEIMIYFVCCSIFGFLLLETVNYIEHYGFKEIKMIKVNTRGFNRSILGILIIPLVGLCYLNYQDILITILTHQENIKF